MQALWRTAYALLLALLLPFHLLSKLRRNGVEGLRLQERLGNVPPAGAEVWVNFASLGEFNACRALLERLRARPLKLLLTHAAEAVRPLAARALDAPIHALPLDFASIMGRFCSLQRPRLCILVEQELWPNLIRLASRHGPVAVVNARMSRRAARRHARWGAFTRPMFANLALVCAQDRDDARRFRVLGAPAVQVTGNMKFDRQPDSAKVAQGLRLRERLQEAWPGRPVLLLASTRARARIAEERLLLQALAPLLERIVLLIAPRHLERMDGVASMLAQRGAFSRRSILADEARPEALVLGDTLGDMDSYIACADVVFVGASLIPLGGQNPLEGCAQGKAVVCGPHMENFASLMHQARAARAVQQCPDADAVAAACAALLQDEPERQAMGERAAALARRYGGATERTLAQLEPLLPPRDESAS